MLVVKEFHFQEAIAELNKVLKSFPTNVKVFFINLFNVSVRTSCRPYRRKQTPIMDLVYLRSQWFNTTEAWN